MERGWRLADFLTIPAGELLANRLDDFPLAWNDLQRIGDIFTIRLDPQQSQCVGARTMTRSRGK